MMKYSAFLLALGRFRSTKFFFRPPYRPKHLQCKQDPLVGSAVPSLNVSPVLEMPDNFILGCIHIYLFAKACKTLDPTYCDAACLGDLKHLTDVKLFR